MDNKNIVVFLDQVGRTLFAEKLEDRSNEEHLVIKNPVVVHISAKPGGEMSLQLIPIFFKEFSADKDQDVVFTFNIKNITLADPMLYDHKFHANYRNMFSKEKSTEKVDVPKTAEIIDLFDSNEKK